MRNTRGFFVTDFGNIFMTNLGNLFMPDFFDRRLGWLRNRFGLSGQYRIALKHEGKD
jgi:hypothetical protein